MTIQEIMEDLPDAETLEVLECSRRLAGALEIMEIDPEQEEMPSELFPALIF